jgi:hypothetical protein
VENESSDGLESSKEQTNRPNRKEILRKLKAEAEARLTALTQVASLPEQKKKLGGRPKGKYNKDISLTDDDLKILNLLMVNGNKKLVSRINGIQRQEIYRLLNSKRLQKITLNAENRLQALLEACVMLVESAVVEDADLSTAKELLRNFGLLKSDQLGKALPAGTRKTTLEEVMDADGTKTRRVIKEGEAE